MGEFCLNIWYIVDIDTDLCSYYIIRHYYLSGDDNEKTSILKKLAETDYKCENRVKLADANTYILDGEVLKGYIHSSDLESYFMTNFDHIISVLENKLPLEFKFHPTDYSKCNTSKQVFPRDPLYLHTILMEDSNGNIKPYTSKENIDWYNQIKNRDLN